VPIHRYLKEASYISGNVPRLEEGEVTPMYHIVMPVIRGLNTQGKVRMKRRASDLSTMLIRPMFPIGSAATQLLYEGEKETSPRLILGIKARYPNLYQPMEDCCEGREGPDARVLQYVSNDLHRLLHNRLATSCKESALVLTYMTEEQRASVIDFWK
jgi:hypothetical protein